MITRLIIRLTLLGLVLVLLRFGWLFRNYQQLQKISSGFSRDYYVGKGEYPPLTYLVMGDSTAVGTGVSKLEDSYPYQVAQHLANQGRFVHVLNVAQNGARLEDMVAKQFPEILTRKPEVVTISIGANNATHLTDLNQYGGMIREIATEMDEVKDIKILIANAPDMAKPPALPSFYATKAGAQAAKQNTLLKDDLALSPLIIVDWYGQGKLESSVSPSLYASDQFHPSKEGYARWAKLFIQKL